MLQGLEARQELPPAEQLHVCNPREGVGKAMLKFLADQEQQRSAAPIVVTGRRPFVKKILKVGARPMLMKHFKNNGEGSSGPAFPVATAVAADHVMDHVGDEENEPYLGEPYLGGDGGDDGGDDGVLVNALDDEDEDSDSDEDSDDEEN